MRAFIIEALREEVEPGLPISGGSVLLGQGAVVSSLGLVGLLVRVEDYCQEHGRSFNWAVDSAMSAKNSPFRTVNTLVAYVAAAPEEQ